MKIIIILVLLLIVVLFYSLSENFTNFETTNWFVQNNVFFQPWWNATRHTRNMNYDIRGDPVVIPKDEFIWNNSDRNGFFRRYYNFI